MAVCIRLRRIGKNPKRRPHFRFSVFSKTRGRDSRCLEELGYYNPITKSIKINRERLGFWIQKGAEISTTVKNLVKKLDKEVKNAGSNS